MKAVQLPGLASQADLKGIQDAATKIKIVAASANYMEVQISFHGMNASEVVNFELPAPALLGIGELLEVMSKALPTVISVKSEELTTSEAAKFLGVSRNFIVLESDRGNLICRKVGRHRRYSPDVLERYQRLHAGKNLMHPN